MKTIRRPTGARSSNRRTRSGSGRPASPLQAAAGIAARLVQGQPEPLAAEAGSLLENLKAVQDAFQPLDLRDGVILIDNDGRIMRTNARTFSLFPGQAAALTRGAGFADFIQSAMDAGIFLCGAGQTPGELFGRLAIPRDGSIDIPLPDEQWLRVSTSATSSGGWVVVYTDVTTLRHREDDLVLANAGLEAALVTQRWRESQTEEAHTRLDAALSHMSQGLCMFDVHRRVVLANRRFAEIFKIPYDRIYPGLSLSKLASASIRAGNHQDDGAPPDLDRLAETLIGSADGLSAQARIGDRVIAISRNSMPDGGFVTTYEDITERRQAEDQVTFMAHHDALTGLANRILFAQRLDAALLHMDMDHPPAICCLDLDRFKGVNDTFGHATGDLLLKEVSRRILSCVRESDTVARFGGDEFVVMLPSTGSVQAVEATAARIVSALAEPYVLDGVKLASGSSVGVAFALDPGDTREQLLGRGDVALYDAKAAGRSQYRMFRPGMDDALQARQKLEHDVLHALERDELFLMFQPLLDTITRKVVGFEALLRWRHSTRGDVPVTTLIQTAEATGAIVDIGNWVMRQACAEAMRWPDNIRLSVNISPVQFRKSDLAAMVFTALSDSGLPHTRLEIEITESILLRNETRTIETLSVLRENGIRVSIDDFGIGHASLKYLLDFPFDRIKIDQVFTQKLLVDSKAEAIMTAIIDLSHSLGVRTTIEGIEMESQLRVPCVKASTEIQGYYFSEPVLPAAIPAVLKRLNGPGADALAKPARS